MRFRLVWALLATSLTAPGFAASAPPDAPDAAIAAQARGLLQRAVRADGPGAVLHVVRGGRVVFRGARGRAHVELGVPLAADHGFRIASVTKVFTAATVLKLAEAGRVSLEAPLATYLPDFPGAGAITIRQLLNHTAGISDRATSPQPGFSRRDVDLAARVAAIADRPPDFAPGTRWAYSNSGYVLLGAVIEMVTGEPWHQAVHGQVVAPLGLERTVYGAHGPLIAGRAAGYTTDKASGVVSNAPFISMTIPAAAGGLLSTADDLSHWMRALAGGRVVRPQGFRDMTAPANVPAWPTRTRYGLGVYLWSVRGTAMIGHTGQIDGFAAAVGHLPEHGITAVVLANDDTFDARVALRRLAAIALGRPYAEVAPTPITPGGLALLQGTYGLDEATTRTLLVKDGTLHAQRPGRAAIPLQLTAAGHLHFVPDELSHFAPVRDAGGRVTALDYFEDGDGPPLRLPRVEGR